MVSAFVLYGWLRCCCCTHFFLSLLPVVFVFSIWFSMVVLSWIRLNFNRTLKEFKWDEYRHTHKHTNNEAKRQSTRRQANACTYSLHISINNQNNRPRKQQSENMERKEKLWLWNSQPTKQCTSKESKAFENPPNKMCDDQHQNKNRNNDGMAKYHCYQCWSSIILLSCVFLTFFGLQFQ